MLRTFLNSHNKTKDSIEYISYTQHTGTVRQLNLLAKLIKNSSKECSTPWCIPKTGTHCCTKHILLLLGLLYGSSLCPGWTGRIISAMEHDNKQLKPLQMLTKPHQPWPHQPQMSHSQKTCATFCFQGSILQHTITQSEIWGKYVKSMKMTWRFLLFYVEVWFNQWKSAVPLAT